MTKNNEKICDFTYLSDTMGGDKHLIKEVMDVFLEQIPEDLQIINNAILNTDYATIKSFAHKMKSSVAMFGISVLKPVLQEMNDLGASETNIEKIKELNQKLNLICDKAIQEVEIETQNYVIS